MAVQTQCSQCGATYVPVMSTTRTWVEIGVECPNGHEAFID